MLKSLYYFRSVLTTIIIGLHTLILSIVVTFLLVIRAPRKLVDFVIGPVWCGGIVKFSGIIPVVEGVENVPKDKGFLYLFTHSSHMDIPVMFVASPKSFRFGAKASLFKIPIFGATIRLAGTLKITREDRAKVMAVYKEAQARVAKGEAFALAPEGGRRQGQEILDFKSGPFIFAINAAMPIVPVVLSGVDQVLPKSSLLPNKDAWSRPVGVRFLPAIETKDLDMKQARELKARVREQMVQAYQEMSQIYGQ